MICLRFGEPGKWFHIRLLLDDCPKTEYMFNDSHFMFVEQSTTLEQKCTHAVTLHDNWLIHFYFRSRSALSPHEDRRNLLKTSEEEDESWLWPSNYKQCREHCQNEPISLCRSWCKTVVFLWFIYVSKIHSKTNNFIYFVTQSFTTTWTPHSIASLKYENSMQEGKVLLP